MKFLKEKEKDIKTLAKENKRLQIFIIIFMVIALCLATFYFNVICFGTGCESKSPKPLITINSSKSSSTEKTNEEDKSSDNTEVETSSNYSYEDMYAVYASEDGSNKEIWLTLHKDGNFVYSYDNKTIKGNYSLENNKVNLIYVSESSNGVTNQITGTKKFSIISKAKLYDDENLINLNRTNIPTNQGE